MSLLRPTPTHVKTRFDLALAFADDSLPPLCLQLIEAALADGQVYRARALARAFLTAHVGLRLLRPARVAPTATALARIRLPR